MIPKTDYHIHTSLCGHAIGECRDYVQQAEKMGLEEVGFSDHAPFVDRVDPAVTMSRDQLPFYQQMMEGLRRDSCTLSIKIGIEADFIPGFEKQTKELLDGYAYDYVIGSVHFLKDWAFDCPNERQSWDGKDVNQVYRTYQKTLREAAQSQLFDIMGHVDLVKKFGHRASEDISAEIKKTAEVFKKFGVAIEINTSGLRKPVGEIYPALKDLTIYARAGVPIVFGSDAHRPQEVGADFDQARLLALRAGFQQYCIFEKRKIVGQIPL